MWTGRILTEAIFNLRASNLQGSPVEVKHVFCRQVSAAQYEEQRKCHAHQHMSTLLDGILADRNMSDKEKCSKLKMVSTGAVLFQLVLSPLKCCTRSRKLDTA